jgi:hypothetical protein
MIEGLTSPGSQVALGKRARKSVVHTFAGMMGDDDSDDYDDSA